MQQVPIVEVARLWLGCVWIIASVLKVVQHRAARAYVKRRIRGSDGVAKVIVAAISVSEIAIGASLLVGFVVTQAAVLAMALLTAFTLIVVSSPDRESGCGCFGALDSTADIRWIVIARNGTMSAVALLIIADRSGEGASMIRDPLAWLFAVTLVGLFAVAYFIGARLTVPTTQGLSGNRS